MAKSMGKVWRKYGKSIAHTSKVWPIYGLAIPIPDFEKPSQYSYPNFFKIYNPDMTASELIINNYKSQSHGL